MERKREEALAKSQLGPVSFQTQKPETVPSHQLMDRDQQWLWYFKESELVRKGHGVVNEGKGWVIVDRALFDRTVDETRKALLRPVWKNPSKDDR
jgi:hypothetical protein